MWFNSNMASKYRKQKAGKTTKRKNQTHTQGMRFNMPHIYLMSKTATVSKNIGFECRN